MPSKTNLYLRFWGYKIPITEFTKTIVAYLALSGGVRVSAENNQNSYVALAANNNGIINEPQPIQLAPNSPFVPLAEVMDLRTPIEKKDSYIIKARKNNELGNYDEALLDLTDALAIENINKSDLFLMRAEIYIKQGNVDAAMEDYLASGNLVNLYPLINVRFVTKQIGGIAPTDREYYLRAEVTYATRFSSSVDYYKTVISAYEDIKNAIKLETTPNHEYNKLYNTIINSRDYKIRYHINVNARSYDTEQPDVSAYYQSKAIEDIQGNNYEQALKNANIAVETSSAKHFSPFLLRAEIYIKLGKIEPAIKDYLSVTALTKGSVDKKILAKLDNLLDDLEKLFSINEQQKNPPTSDQYFTLAVFYNERQYPGKAIKMATKAIESDKGRNQTYHDFRDKTSKAQEDLAIKMKEDATKQMDLGHYTEALEIINFALERVEENNSDLLIMRGDIHMQLGNLDLAIADYLASTKFSKSIKEASAKYAFALEIKNEKEKLGTLPRILLSSLLTGLVIVGINWYKNKQKMVPSEKLSLETFIRETFIPPMLGHHFIPSKEESKKEDGSSTSESKFVRQFEEESLPKQNFWKQYSNKQIEKIADGLIIDEILSTKQITDLLDIDPQRRKDIGDEVLKNIIGDLAHINKFAAKKDLSIPYINKTIPNLNLLITNNTIMQIFRQQIKLAFLKSHQSLQEPEIEDTSTSSTTKHADQLRKREREVKTRAID